MGTEPMARRASNRTDRRLAPRSEMGDDQRRDLCKQVQYTGSSYHKSNFADYDLEPPCSPRPDKSLCDDRRTIKRAEAAALLAKGIARGFFSVPVVNGIPKYVWAVDQDNEVYEAKTHPPEAAYHGYRLDHDDPQRAYILQEWKKP